MYDKVSTFMAYGKKVVMACEHGIDFRAFCATCDATPDKGYVPMGPTVDEQRDDYGWRNPKPVAKEQQPQGRLTSDAKARKDIPLATGCLDYFPDALAAIATLSRIGNDKHNPGQPLHWSRGKSNDHPDCLMRHFLERGTVDTSGAEPVLHSTQMAWRALAILQLEIEASREIRP